LIIPFKRTLESLGNRAHCVRGHRAPRRVLRRRMGLSKGTEGTETQGVLKDAVVIRVDLVHGSL